MLQHLLLDWRICCTECNRKQEKTLLLPLIFSDLYFFLQKQKIRQISPGMANLETVHFMESQWKVFTDCMQSLHHLNRPNKISYICKKRTTASYFQMEEEHRLEEYMRSSVTDSSGCHLYFTIYLANCGLQPLLSAQY